MSDLPHNTEIAKPDRHFLVSKNKSIRIDSSGTLLINERKYEPRDGSNNLIEVDPIFEARKQTREFYKNLLVPQVENLIVLSGAGTSVGIGRDGKLGKSMLELWATVEKKPEIALSTFCTEIGFAEKGDLERLLSKANRAIEFKETDVKDKIAKIENVIKENCTLQLPDNSPHEIFLNRITERKIKHPRVKLFTLNYDTLFEQAAETAGFTIIDGFSFSAIRTFRGTLFDLDLVIREKSRIRNEENFAPKVFHLYKVHGSVDWTLDGQRIIQTKNPASPLMIYPRDTKYEHSFEQPFFEMTSRFQQSLRQENVQLLTIGFSLNDKHITTSIREAVSQNPSFHVVIVNRTIRTDPEWQWFIEKAKTDSRITLISEEFETFARNYPEDETITQGELLRRTYNA